MVSILYAVPVTNQYNMTVGTGMHSTPRQERMTHDPTANDPRSATNDPHPRPKRRPQLRKIRYDPWPMATSRVSPSGVVSRW